MWCIFTTSERLVVEVLTIIAIQVHFPFLSIAILPYCVLCRFLLLLRYDAERRFGRLQVNLTIVLLLTSTRTTARNTVSDDDPVEVLPRRHVHNWSPRRGVRNRPGPRAKSTTLGLSHVQSVQTTASTSRFHLQPTWPNSVSRRVICVSIRSIRINLRSLPQTCHQAFQSHGVHSVQ